MATKTDHQIGLGLALVEAFEEFGPLYRSHVGSLLPEGVSDARLRALAVLAENGDMTLSELRGHIGGSAQNTTGLVDSMEAEGLVARQAHPKDRRKTIIQLSPNSRRQIMEQRAEHRGHVAEVFGNLSQAEQQTLITCLKKLVEAMR